MSQPRGRGGSRGGYSSRGGGNQGRGGHSLPFHSRGREDVPCFSQGPVVPPSTAVEKLEDETIAKIKASKATTSTATAVKSAMPLRPGYGTIGKPVTLTANQFELTSSSNKRFVRYSIDVDGTVPKSKMHRVVEQLMDQIRSQHKAKLALASDYRALIISDTDLQLDSGTVFRIVHCPKVLDEPDAKADVFKIRLIRKDSPTIQDILNYLSSTSADASFDLSQEVIQALNVIIGHLPKSQSNMLTISGNKHYKIDGPMHNLGAGLLALRGFFLSVRPATGRLLVNVQPKSLAVYMPGPLPDLIRAYGARSNAGLHKFLHFIKVEVTHIVKKNKKGEVIPRFKTIHGLAAPGDGKGSKKPPIVPKLGATADEVQFWLDADVSTGQDAKKPKPQPAKTAAGNYITVAKFFKQTYNITTTKDQVINVGSKERPMYLPAQVCKVIAGQPAKQQLSPRQTAEMINFSVHPPYKNGNAIMQEGVPQLGFDNGSSALASFDLAVSTKMITVPGKVLQPPVVHYAGKQEAKPRFGSWNMAKIQFDSPAQNFSWVYLFIRSTNDQSFRPWRDQGHLEQQLVGLQTEIVNCGMRTATFAKGLSCSVNPQDYNHCLERIQACVDRFMNNPNNKAPSLIVGVIDNGDKTIYRALKQVCDIRQGIRNTNVNGAKFIKANEQTYANIALKINAKLGGRNQVVDTSKVPMLKDGTCMLVGLDVTHPQPGARPDAPSVAAIVASTDAKLGQWPAELRIQARRQEEVANVDDLLKGRLLHWQKVNSGRLPESIIIYRDGVSEGQYTMVLEKELPGYKNACRQVYPANKMPKISVLIVGKRHHTRFYATSDADGDRNKNPQSGTYVDRGVTEARNWDFFLQAHAAIKGTARPAHYYVVHDEIFKGLKVVPPFKTAADLLIDFTHNLCYTFSRATKAISICPPAYYADLACERARMYLSGYYEPSTQASSDSGSDAGPKDVTIHRNLQNTMFYI